MARKSRGESIDPSMIQVVHVCSRCVRQEYLLQGGFGENAQRRERVRLRLEFLAGVFAVDVITFSIMCNHIHQLLRSRRDIVETWDEYTIARKVAQLSAGHFCDGTPKPISPRRFQEILDDPEKIALWRRRLSDISWMMRYFNQHIACFCNRQDGKKGHFFEERFYSEVLIDEAFILACLLYIDLNPVRANMAQTPEESDYTGAKERIDDLRICLVSPDVGVLSHKISAQVCSQWERLGGRTSSWLTPIEIDEACHPIGPDPEPTGRRASRKGILNLSLLRYLELLDWSGRIIKKGKHGAIPADLAPVLTRLGTDSKNLIDRLLWPKSGWLKRLQPPDRQKSSALESVQMLV